MRVALAVLLACGGPGEHGMPDPATRDDGVLGAGLMNPFPSRAMLGGDGTLDLRGLPSGGPSPIPVDRLAWRTGFSPAQTALITLPGLDPSNLPTYLDVAPGQGSVRLVDLTAGVDLACMAELDAFPDTEVPALIVRPLEALPVGHDVAVVVLTEAVARPEGFDPDRPETRAVLDALDGLGIDEDDVAVAWDFPIADGTAPLRSAVEQLTVPGGHTVTNVRNLDDGDDMAPFAWRAAEGTFRVVDFLIDDRRLELLPDGSVTPTGEVDAYFYIHIPISVADAPAGSVPVMVFGHGIFAQPSDYLNDLADDDGILALADEGGFIVVATTWRGLTAADRIVPVEIASDFGLFPSLTDMLVQGQVNTRTLIEYAGSGGFLDDPVFRGASGQSLPDPGQIVYYGVSLGGIEGAVLLAQDPPVRGGVLHVGGAMWSTMLERSSNWSLFEALLVPAVPDATDRQILYAVSQLWWDPVDPMSWTAELRGRSLLLQEAMGDEQVPNLTTEAFARSIGLPLLEPSVTSGWGLPGEAAPLGPGSRALVQFDPEVAHPEPVNRPAPVTDAHYGPRDWVGQRRQVIDHLTGGSEGQVVHHCGAEPCSASNQGQ